VRLNLQHVECFHLVFLRMLEVRLDRARWVVKGGVNLRAWFGSVRYSEDLDVDVIRGSVHALQERIDSLLGSAAFRDMLAAQGLELTRSSKPKQTETTQRWKCEVRAEGATVPLHARVEFSRRGSAEEYALEPVRPEIVRPYGMLAPTANHYTARSAVRQKIEALANRKETQARDIWDLEHLLRTTGVNPGPFTSAQRKTLGAALDRAMSLSFDVFKSQVVPYLAPERQKTYGTPDAWARICELVVDRLSEFLP
jgi:predicted nucleotidyltransferase component of viral defense system